MSLTYAAKTKIHLKRPYQIQLEFADGVVVLGSLTLLSVQDGELSIPKYATAKGNTVNARVWEILYEGASRKPQLKIRARKAGKSLP